MTSTQQRTAEIAVIVGSLRSGSVNRQVAQVAADVAPEGATVRIVEDLSSVPFYDEDVDAEPLDPAAARLRAAVDSADAVLIVTPEYNGTMPAVVKNAIDWTSRPFGAGALRGKPVAVIGASAGRYGGKWAIADTQRSVGVAGGVVVEEAAVPIAAATLGDAPVAEVAEVTARVRDAVVALADAVAV
ncbi:NADPH-dependent FMN reductase [Williamsia sp. SKLECPSW1]